MIVTVAKMIKVDLPGSINGYTLTCDGRAPGVVQLTCRNSLIPTTVELPGNKEDAERLIAAYRRVLAEDVAYSAPRSE